uniref:NADH dehydrogenase subunit 4L n=1 Tax=Chyliza chikuni TaxID=2963720 RepID=UPI002114DDB0|nr:NADH dehydrogenase subunit 4L [Chyliza chikuni]UTM10333.1 NADH dehydrogenase subunit 4L [Chyliza chikuni]
MLNLISLWLSSFLFIGGSLVFVSQRKHLLSMLLSLEYMVLSLFFLLYVYLNFMSFEQFFSMMFLTFSVCEGALGLSILVSMIRTHGNDYFQSFNILEC